MRLMGKTSSRSFAPKLLVVVQKTTITKNVSHPDKGMERQEVALESLEWVGEKPREIKSALAITTFLQRAQIPPLVTHMSHPHCPRALAHLQKLSHLWEPEGGESPGKT